MSSARYETIVALLGLATLSGCAGNGNGLDSNGNPIGSGSGGSGPLTADFQSIQDHIFTPICTKCHIGASAPQGLQLDQAHSYSLLVGVPSTEQPDVLRVAPGAPDNSYIVRKLQGTAGISGEQMPLGGPYLPQSTIDVIRQWISAGAPKGSAATNLEAAVKAVQRFAVTVSSPDDQSIASAAVTQIVVGFNGEIDPNLLNGQTVELSRTDTGPPVAIPISTSVPAGNPSAVLLRPRTALGDGTYRVTLHGSLANMNAQALGTAYSFTFTVDALQ